MGRRLAYKHIYPFAWLDEAVGITLDPDKEFVHQLQIEELERLQEKVNLETWEVFRYLKAETFYIFSHKKMKTIVQKYNRELLLLKQQAAGNLEKYPHSHLLKITGDLVVKNLNELSTAIEKWYPEYLPEQINNSGDKLKLPDKDPFKIICELSVDQMGIMLKAADDIKLIVSRSLSMVFKSIVPYLSTSKKKELSWDSMRSNSYHPEERDKEVAIVALEKMIGKIKAYK